MPRQRKENALEVNRTTNSHKRKYACLEDRRLEKNIRRTQQNKMTILHTTCAENIEIDPNVYSKYSRSAT